MRNCFIISSSDASVVHLKRIDKRLEQVIEMIGDINCGVHDDPFQFVVEEIVGQMLSNKVADVICDRLHAICKNEITPDSILRLSVNDLRGIGLSNAKSEYILNFANVVSSNQVCLSDLEELPDEEVTNTLTKIRGIGSWTAKMYLIFVLRREDVIPFEDGAFLQAYKWLYEVANPSKEEILSKGREWSPFASIAARYLYRALDMGLTKNKITAG